MQINCYISNQMGGASRCSFLRTILTCGTETPQSGWSREGRKEFAPRSSRKIRGKRIREKRALSSLHPTPTYEESNRRRPREEPSLYFETIGGILVAGTRFRLQGAQCLTPTASMEKDEKLPNPGAHKLQNMETLFPAFPPWRRDWKELVSRGGVGGPYL
ncbi:hypothetical protein HJG60_010155 [Phyllostomus discolor]|uniref:Uncharacterized protein n=1 Tax=Phyllostomus discolor TaxID=89673 RepID=A0A834AW45_9CHIR|nr:hypothetical protein HJG60_010155 [Phyllostomus discolor]